MQKTLASIIKEIEDAKTEATMVKVMQKNSSAQLKTLLGYALDPAVKWLLPVSDPPYRALPKAADQESKLYNDARMLIYFVNSPDGRNLTQVKREQLFIQMLESVDPDDAVLLLRVKNKALNIPTKAVKKAFPNMTKDWP